MFTVGQVAAVQAAFALAGHDGAIRTLPVDSEDERIFVLPRDRVPGPDERRLLEQVLTQLLGRKVWVSGSTGRRTVPFG